MTLTLDTYVAKLHQRGTPFTVFSFWMQLQRQWSLPRNTRQLGIVDDQLVVERDCQAVALQGDVERVPLANRIVSLHLRCHPGMNHGVQGCISQVAPHLARSDRPAPDVHLLLVLAAQEDCLRSKCALLLDVYAEESSLPAIGEDWKYQADLLERALLGEDRGRRFAQGPVDQITAEFDLVGKPLGRTIRSPPPRRGPVRRSAHRARRHDRRSGDPHRPDFPGSRHLAALRSAEFHFADRACHPGDLPRVPNRVGRHRLIRRGD